MKINLIISDSYYFIKDTLNKIYGDFSNVVKIDLNDSSIDDILYEFSSVSLFDDEKYVVVENADKIFDKGFEDESLTNYFDHPSEITKVVFITKKVDKKNIYYSKIFKDYKIYESISKNKFNIQNDVKEYIKRHGSHISEKALNYIAESCLNDYDIMLSEIDKLLILGKDNISDELAFNLVSLTPDGNNNRFIDALMDMNEKEALKCVNNMKILNIDISSLVALLAWNVRVTYLIKHYRKDSNKLNEVLTTFNIKDFSYNKLSKKANIRTEEEFLNLLVELSNIDMGIKEFKFDKENLGYYLINLFCI